MALKRLILACQSIDFIYDFLFHACKDTAFLWMGKRLVIKNPETWKMPRDSVDMRLCSLF
jgi:hypothetical protein